MPDHLSIRHVKLSSLHLDPANARTHGNDNLEAIVGSLKRFGQAEPLVVQKATGRVIGGNGRMLAMQKLGWKKCDIVEVDVDDLTATALGIALNRTGELAEWNEDSLAKILYELKQKDALEGLGYGEKDVEDLFRQYGLGEGGMAEDPGPEAPPEKATTLTGDLWLLGDHRLLCGDSTKAEDVARLMAGKKAAIMNTDPPYGVAYANDDRPGVTMARPRVANDQLHDDDLQRFLEACFRVAANHALKENAAWYLWHAHLTQGFFAAAAAAADVVLSRQIIWVKNNMLLTRGQYHWKHEPCFFGWVEGHQPPDYGRGAGERDQTTVWEVHGVSPGEREEFNHSTPKPVELFSIPIVKHCRSHEIAYEPFAGTGPQFIAAEQLGRRCFGLEIEPRYCDVILRRWEKATGKEAVLEGTCQTFAQISREREAKAAEEPSPATPT